MSWGWLPYAVCLWLGWRAGLRVGFSTADDNWIEHLKKHGWKLERDEDDPEGPGIPKQMYGDHWYERRDADEQPHNTEL